MATTSAAQGGTVGDGAVLSGKVKGQNLSVLGTLEGEVHLEGRLSVGPKGRVSAVVRAAEVVVEGEIEGDVRTESLTLTETATARGTFVAKRLVVKEGALVEGAVNPVSAGGEPPPAAVVPAAVVPVPVAPPPAVAPPAAPPPTGGPK